MIKASASNSLGSLLAAVGLLLAAVGSLLAATGLLLPVGLLVAAVGLLLAAVGMLLAFLIPIAAQTDSPQWGQCGGQGWIGPTSCPEHWVRSATCQYHSQCRKGNTPTFVAGTSFIRAMEPEGPNFHKYFHSKVDDTVASDAILVTCD